jgi:predicted ester cyclase
VLSCGDHTVVRWTYQATHQHGELLGVEPTGKIVHVSGITIYQIRDGRVQREDGVVDNLSLLLQLRGHL